jgi:hypothetical protein
MSRLLMVDEWDNTTGECEAEPVVVTADRSMVSLKLWNGKTLILNRSELFDAITGELRQEEAA